MGTIGEYLRRAVDATGQAVITFFEGVGEMPVHCSRCKRAYKLREGAVKPLYDIRDYRGTLQWFCSDCAAAIRAEYRYRCTRCGGRHNRPDFALCRACLAEQHPREARRVADHNVRAWDHGAAGTLTVADWLRTLNDWEWRCYCCGGPYEALDHYIPIAKGGGTTAENCFPICKRCNSMKGTFTRDELLLPSPRSPVAHLRIEAYRRTRWPEPRSPAQSRTVTSE